MQVFIGADHRGFQLKEKLKPWLLGQGYEVVDVGADDYNSEDDYVDYAQQVAEQVTSEARGILICGSGHGVEIVANRYPHIRAIVGFNQQVTQQGREHENANVISLPADWLDEEAAKKIVTLFLTTPFSNEERHVRRLSKIEQLETRN